MKATLIVIQNEADHADAKKLIEKLIGSSDSRDRARMVAQARLVEATSARSGRVQQHHFQLFSPT